MGFFSWKTQDTHETIWNKYSDVGSSTTFMHDHEGNVWQEDDYEGYGVFGGKDYYELLAEMNGLQGRDAGIELAFAKPPKAHFAPNLTKRLDETRSYVQGAPESCESQGYFSDEPDYGDYD
jgi:hypothetical protein